MSKKNVGSLWVLCVAASLMAACDGGPVAQGAGHASTASVAAASSAAPPPPPANSFVVSVLAENDGEGDLQGCTTSLTQVGVVQAAGDTFRESRAESSGVGFIRIDGALMRVNLVSPRSKEHGVTHVFEDASHTIRVVETLEVGATNEDTGSTELSGTLTVTYKGTTQMLHVEGGTAC
jgi:hypothetical protein